jgi:very-short-patch-repair endonuclease
MPAFRVGDTVRPIDGPLARKDCEVVATSRAGLYLTPAGAETAGSWYYKRGSVRFPPSPAKANRAEPKLCDGCGFRRNACQCLELRLLQQLRAYRCEEPIREYRFTPLREFRADFAWPDRNLLVEVEGGTYRSRHKSNAGYGKDAEKYNLAAVMGWTVLRFDTEMVTSGRAAIQIEAFLTATEEERTRVFSGDLQEAR